MTFSMQCALYCSLLDLSNEQELPLSMFATMAQDMNLQIYQTSQIA